ncbi:N-acetyl-gamma-glutamyl-phosphate reductase [Prochlorococcus sp. MIT 1300]|uniref:N-acetyl-gamma-glutamyl-phosphate reductase n=1 Tax=Prochlorococcus sp. MIT 1300 TaxID=3096218 RepID=UPI002A75163C|nr:N-acetyl-gamma-glutamyl-phosphate reductase [Prochlorococcus sp. MIT 1300]
MNRSSSQLPIHSTVSEALRVAVVGASGYGGMQLIRLLEQHPVFHVSFLGGERSAGKMWKDVCPFINMAEDLPIEVPDARKIAEKADFAVLSLPNGLSSQLTPKLLELGVRVVDLSADYRYKSLDLWKQVYKAEANKFKRADDELCKKAVYGLPEWNQNAIKGANLVAAPGCFPTASLLPLIPFLKQGLIENDGIVIDAKSGTSGGGRSPKESLLLAEASESIKPYGVIGHRHTSEIEQVASEFAGSSICLQFTPHLIPMVRGLLSTIYARLRDPGLTADDCFILLEAAYSRNNNINVLPVGTYPETKWAKHTNLAFLSLQVDKRTGQLILMSAIDNLLKGQASQAIQCLNVMNKFPEQEGLPLNTYYP